MVSSPVANSESVAPLSPADPAWVGLTAISTSTSAAIAAGPAFAVLLLVFRAPQTVFQSSWFTVSILTELLILLVMRTHKPFFRSRPAPLLLISSAVVAVITFVLPYLPFAPILGLTPIRPLLLLSLLGITSLSLLVTEVAKRLFYRRLDSLAASDRKV